MDDELAAGLVADEAEDPLLRDRIARQGFPPGQIKGMAALQRNPGPVEFAG
jgi:hypothetical protein